MQKIHPAALLIASLALAPAAHAQTAAPAKGPTPMRVAAEIGMRTFKGHTDGVTALAFSPDGKILASGSGDRSIILWDVASGSILRRLHGHTAAITALCFAPDGSRLVSTAGEPFADIWNTGSWKIERLCPVGLGASEAAFLPDSATFATADGTTMNTWDAATGEAKASIHLPANISALLALPDGLLLTGDTKGGVIAWDPATGDKKLEHHRPAAAADKGKAVNWIIGLALGQQGHVLICDRDGLWDWDRKSDQFAYVAKQLFGVSGLVSNGHYILGGRDKDVWLREVDPTGIALPFRLGFDVHAVAASPAGDFWAYGGHGEWANPITWRRGPGDDIRVLKVAALPHAFEIDHREADAAHAKTPSKPLDRTSIGGTDAAILGWDQAASSEPADHDALP